MKRTTIHISAALALLLGIAACTQDEAGFLPEGAEGTPIVFTATGLNPAATAAAGTRAPVDGNWEGVTSVAVRMDGTVKAYDVTPTTSDNTSATLTSDDPHYWTSHTALVAPQTVATGTAFITCTFNNGKVFVYKMKNDAEWQAGEEYTYTVSLAAAEDPGYTVSEDGKTYTVYTDEGLRNVAKLVNEEWKLDINITLTGDIDLTGIDWTPIGTSFGNSYTGTFDGGGHTITGLTVTTNGQYAGLFGCLGKAGTVKNVVMEGLQITSNHRSGYTGGVVGNSWGTIENCSVSGSVSGTLYVGGVVGDQWGGSTTGCSSSATVKGTQRAGGVAGSTNYDATLTACYATGDMTVENDGTSNAWAGGVVGSNFDGTLTACYWSGLPDNDNGGATKVDGTTVTWQTAVDAMNAALSGKGWQYELKDGNSLPALKKEQ